MATLILELEEHFFREDIGVSPKLCFLDFLLVFVFVVYWVKFINIECLKFSWMRSIRVGYVSVDVEDKPPSFKLLIDFENLFKKMDSIWNRLLR